MVLLHPSIDMSVKIYHLYVEPEIRKHERRIDVDVNVNVQRGKEVVEVQYKRFARI